MVTKHSSPDIEDCVTLYLDIWTLFEDRAFEPNELTEQLVEREREISYMPGHTEPERHLDVLVNHGLLTRDDARYRIRCTPEEDVEAWRDELQSPPEAIHRLVQQAKRRREEERRQQEPLDGEWDTLERNGETFVSIDADEETDETDLVTAVANRLSDPPQYAGIVVRTPAIRTRHVQQLAEELCDADAMATAGLPYHFEKITSDVRGEHKDDLEYRLYLRPIGYSGT